MRRVGHWAHLPVFDATRRAGHWVRLRVGHWVRLRVGRRVHRRDALSSRRKQVDRRVAHLQAVHLQAVQLQAMARLVHRPGVLRYPTVAQKLARPSHAVPVGFHRLDRRTIRPHVLRATNRPNRPREVPPRTRRRSPSGGSPVERCTR